MTDKPRTTDPTFEINLLRCEENNTFSIKGSDYTNLQTTDNISYTLTTPLTNIGTISACNTVTEFIQYSIDNESVEHLILDNIITNFNPNHSTGFTSIYISGDAGNDCFQTLGLLYPAPYTGTYIYNNDADFSQYMAGFRFFDCIEVSIGDPNINFNVTTFGNVGEYIDINFIKK